MKLTTVTLISIIGLSIALALNLARFQWGMLLHEPKLILSLVSISCLYGSLLFFLIHIYFRGQK